MDLTEFTGTTRKVLGSVFRGIDTVSRQRYKPLWLLVRINPPSRQMNRFLIIRRICSLWFTLCAIIAINAVGAAKRPNILFILIDDEGWPTLGSYGCKVVPTPHLDKLADESVRFTDAYVMPLCTPTRAALFTGQYCARTRMWHVLADPWYGYPWAPVREPAYRECLPRDWFTLPKGMRAAGYVTGMAGKWHLTANEDGDYVALNPQAAEAYGFDFVAPRGPGSIHAGDKWVNHLTDTTISFIREHRDQSWFFYLAHHTLHGLVCAPKELVAKYRKQGAPQKGLNNATYLAAIEHLDDSIGRLMAALDEMKLREQTLVVFLSDNGGVSRLYNLKPFLNGPGTNTQLHVAGEEFSNTPLRAGKGAPYEGGIRVPCIVRWPGVTAPGRVIKTPVHIVDWLPTLLDVAGSHPPADYKCDGLGLVPLLRGGRLPERSLFWYMPLYDLRWGATPCAAVRNGDWKFIEYFGDYCDANGKYLPGHHIELFNLRYDVGESTNRAKHEPARKKAMLDELHAFLLDCGDEIPGSNPHHDPSRAFTEAHVKPGFLK